MPQPTDIVLAGAGYMVAPGSYRRSQDGMAEGRTGRVVMRDFFGGQQRPFQLERDRSYAGLGVGPVYNGQGVWPWPAESRQAMPPGASHAFRNVRLPAVAIGNYVYFATGTKVYRTVAMDAGTWSTPTLFYDFGGSKNATGLFNARGEIGCSLSMGDVTTVLTTGGAISGPIMGNPYTRFGVGWAGHVVLAQAQAGGATDTVYLTGPNGLESRMLDSPVANIALWAGKVAIATRQSLYSFAGHTDEGGPHPSGYWSGEMQPFHSEAWSGELDDFVFLTGYGGKLYTWVAGQCVEFNPNGDRAGWRATGLEGVRCYGGCVAGGFLIVAVETVDGRSQLWAWDGAGWWRFRDAAASSIRSIWPVNLAGAGNWDLMVFRDDSAYLDLFRLIWRDGSLHALSRSAQMETSMLDAGERDKDKAWRKAGAVFAAPALHGTVPESSSCTLYLNARAEGEAAWTQVGTVTKAGNTLPNMNVTLEGPLSKTSRFLQVQTTWEPGGGWAPILTALWAEYETLDSPVRRRKWQLVVAARDQTIDRNGAQLTRTGRALIAELWSAWQTDSVLSFRDQDYDADPTERTVRIVGIEEQVADQRNASQWGASLVKLTLVEV